MQKRVLPFKPSPLIIHFESWYQFSQLITQQIARDAQRHTLFKLVFRNKDYSLFVFKIIQNITVKYSVGWFVHEGRRPQYR